jgi:hypothetical protein
MIKQVITLSAVCFSSLTGCFNPSIVGGLLSGGLHAISGPDHLAALLPPSVGKPGWYGLRLGATWGMGHGVSAIFLGMCAYFLKGRISTQFKFLQQLSLFAEALVGLSLFVIGAIGIKENIELKNELESLEIEKIKKLEKMEKNKNLEKDISMEVSTINEEVDTIKASQNSKMSISTFKSSG